MSEKVTVNLYIDKETLDAVDDFADKIGMSRSATVNKILASVFEVGDESAVTFFKQLIAASVKGAGKEKSQVGVAVAGS